MQFSDDAATTWDDATEAVDTAAKAMAKTTASMKAGIGK